MYPSVHNVFFFDLHYERASGQNSVAETADAVGIVVGCHAGDVVLRAP